MTEVEELGNLDASKKFRDREVHNVANFRELREASGYTAFKLAIDADVSVSTINRMEGTGKGTVTARIANQVLMVLSSKLGYRLNIDDVEGLRDKIK